MTNSSDTTEQGDEVRAIFALFNEIGIMEQLSRTLFQSRLEDGLTVQHFSVLNHLCRLGDGKTPMTLARAFQVPKTTMSHTLAGLERRALVTLAPNPEDGRGKLVFITEAGRQRRDTSIEALAPDILRLLPHFSAEEARALLPGLAKIRAILDESRN